MERNGSHHKLETPVFVGRDGLLVIAAVAGTNICLLAIALAVFGTGEAGWHQALRYTIRFAALVFLVIFTTPLLIAIHAETFGFLKKHARTIGFSFAAAFSIHLFAVVQFLIEGGDLPKAPALLMDGAALLSILAMVSTSSDYVMKRIGISTWRTLHVIGLHVIWFTLLTPFLSRVRWDFSTYVYWIYSFLLIGAFLARIQHTWLGRRREPT